MVPPSPFGHFPHGGRDIRAASARVVPGARAAKARVVLNARPPVGGPQGGTKSCTP